MKKLAENFANRSCLRTVCLGLFRDDDFDPGDDEEEAELPEADETQDGDETELLDDTDGLLRALL